MLRTKFFIPKPTPDFVKRKLLDSKFKVLKNIPVMLVSASSGYGKSTLVADFFSNLNDEHAWLSLSEKENEFIQFIQYFILAIQGISSEFGIEALELAKLAEPPTPDELAELLINELADFNKFIYLALDDYHHINNSSIHEFITQFFEYPQPYFKLIIITRRDPELPLSIWRNKNILVEIRSQELRFNRTEITEFYQHSTAVKPDDIILDKIEEATEGWVSGLRMLLLSTNNKEELNNHFLNFNYKNSRVIYDLIESVLSKQPIEKKETFLRLSILKEFNQELFAELCLTEKEKSNSAVIFNEFISNVIQSNMFIIELDDKQNWYRFHHLFNEHLNELLLTKYDKQTISDLVSKAADWFNRNNFHEEAIEYYLKANKVQKALDVFIKYRLTLISETRFQQLEKVYNLFPKKFAKKNGILLVTKGWLILQKGNIPEMAKHIDGLEELLKQDVHPKELLDLLIGELHAMKTFDCYLANVDLQACLEHSKQAIKLIKDKNPYASGMAWVYYGATVQHLGQATKAKKEILEVLDSADNPMMRGHLLLILCFLDWFEGNLSEVIKTAKHILQLGHDSGIKMIIANGNIFQGIANYYQNNDEEAIKYLLESHRLRLYTYLHMSFGTGMALANIYAKKGKMKESDGIIQEYESTALKQGGKLFKKITKANSANISLRYKGEKSGLKWAKENDYKDFLPFASLFSTELIQARILALDSEPDSHQQAQEILNILIPFFEARNDLNVLVRSNTIQALLYYKSKNLVKAFDALQKVLELSTLGHFIRPYLDLGESMKELLLLYKEKNKFVDHIDEILIAFNHKLINGEIELSKREKEILKLSENMSIKELSNKLFISEKTVKTHITNINRKLSTTNRQDALSKAMELALL